MLQPEALEFLLTQMEGLGHYRSGPLFGLWQDGSLSVSVARCGQAQQAQPSTTPIVLDGPYILGLSDGLRAQQPAIEWIGHWVVCPDAQRPDPDMHRQLVELAAKMGLVRYEIPLLVLGWDEFELWYAASTYLQGRGMAETPVVQQGQAVTP